MRVVALSLCCLLIGLLILAPIAQGMSDTLPYPANSTVSDLTLTHWSAFEYARDQLAATGQVPLWRTSILSGTPFAENPLAGLFYPPHWLALFTALPLAAALNILLWLHFSLAGAAMYTLMRRWQVRPLAALASALAYAAAPKIVAHMGLGHLTLVEAWAWLPLVMFPLTTSSTALRMNSQAGRGSRLQADLNHQPPILDRRAAGEGSILAGVALGLCVLADARMAIYGGALAVSYLMVMGVSGSPRRGTWLTTAGRIVIVVIVALTVSAAAWLPTLSLSNNTSRAALAPDEAGVLSLDPIYLLGLLIADRSGAAERTTYMGLVVLALAIIGALRSRVVSRRLRAWLLSVIVIGAIIALGTHTPLYSILSRLPGAPLLRVPARAWFMVVFAMAALAGLGMQTVLISIKRPAYQRVVAVIGLGLIALDLMSVDWAVYRVETVAAAFSPGRDVAAWLADQPGEFRVYSPSLSIPQHVAQQFNLQLADGVDPLQLAWYVMYMQAATGVGAWGYSVTLPPFPGIQTDADVSTALKSVVPDAQLLGHLNVKYVVAGFPIASPDLIERARFGDTVVYQNVHVQPRAFMTTAFGVPDAPLNDVTVDGLPFPIDLNMPAGQVRAFDTQANRLAFEANGPGLLVLSEVYAPDWTATVDGKSTAIWRTNETLRGVIVPWGTHTIELEYQPRRVYAGALISLLSVIACLGAWMIERRRAK